MNWSQKMIIILHISKNYQTPMMIKFISVTLPNLHSNPKHNIKLSVTSTLSIIILKPNTGWLKPCSYTFVFLRPRSFSFLVVHTGFNPHLYVFFGSYDPCLLTLKDVKKLSLCYVILSQHPLSLANRCKENIGVYMWRYSAGFHHNELSFSHNTAKQRIQNLESRKISWLSLKWKLMLLRLCPFMLQHFLQSSKEFFCIEKIKMSTVWYS